MEEYRTELLTSGSRLNEVISDVMRRGVGQLPPALQITSLFLFQERRSTCVLTSIVCTCECMAGRRREPWIWLRTDVPERGERSESGRTKRRTRRGPELRQRAMAKRQTIGAARQAREDDIVASTS